MQHATERWEVNATLQSENMKGRGHLEDLRREGQNDIKMYLE